MLGKDLFIRDVVGNAGEDGWIGRQCMGTESFPGALENRTEEIVGSVRGIGGAATIATQEDLAPLPTRLIQCLSQLVNNGPILAC